MKTTIQSLMAAMLVAASTQIHAQSSLIYDQQSTNPPSILGDYLNIQEDSPLTQSFIPALSAIGFVQFEFWDIPNNGNNGATVYVNLLTGSSNPSFATLVASTAPIYMPNGFGSVFPGVTNFYFSTPVMLTSGQTYYLQPVVLSGDDPWDIWDPGDTYPNGQLFERGAGFSKDLWFREGVVPEPSTLALIGLGSLLVCAFKRRSKLMVSLLFAASVLPVYSAPDSVVQVTADAAGLTRVSATALPRIGTFWVMKTGPDGDLIGPPYPFLPPGLSSVPTYLVTGNIFIVDDTGGQLLPSSAGRLSNAQAASTMQAQATTMANLIERIQNPPPEEEFRPDGFVPMFDMSSLWLEASNENNGYVGLRAHNTINGDNYQLLSTTDLLNTNWDLGQILSGASDYTDFTPVPTTSATNFFRVHHANPVFSIANNTDSEELNPTNTSNPGHTGIIYIYEEGSATNDLTVYYTIGGTAQNGIDYSNLMGVATVPLNQGNAEIDINPTADGLKPNQTVILTLVQNTNYLIDPANYSATNTLYANPQVYPTVNGDNERVCPNTLSPPIYLTSDANDPRGLTLTYSILTLPTHGILNTNSLPSVTYTPTNCYEGQDSFTFQVSDGEYASTGTVNLSIADPVSASSPTTQTCRGMTSASFSLGSDNCGETLGYYLLSSPAYGTLSGTAANLTYTPTGTNYTGTDSFNYILYSACGGDSDTGTVTVTVGDQYISATPQTLITPTNQSVAVTLTFVDYDNCHADTNYYLYTVISGPTNGILSGSGANRTYTPTNNFEGMDSFQFTVSDGGWSNVATVTIDVVGGLLLTNVVPCNPFRTALQLDWSFDAAVSNLVYQDGMNINYFIIYRSTNSGSSYTAIATVPNSNQLSYIDFTAAPGQTNYYMVTFQVADVPSGVLVESPFSNKVQAWGTNPNDMIPPNAIWQVATNVNTPFVLTSLQAPFSSYGTNQYPGLYPLPNTFWPIDTTWTNHIALVIPTNVTDFSQVYYSIAIDNQYWLYVNGSYIGTGSNYSYAVWSNFQPFPVNTLHYGTNNIVVGIQDTGGIDYFSMVVTTNTCGQ